METDIISCRMCGGTSFTKNDKTAKCDYCGAEFEIAQLQARAARLEAEQKTLDSLADNMARLRQIADQKEAERQRAAEEEKRRQEEEEKRRQEEQRKKDEAQKALEEEQKKKKEIEKLQTKRGGVSCLTLIICFFLMTPLIESLLESRIPAVIAFLIIILFLSSFVFVPYLIFPSKKKLDVQNEAGRSHDASDKEKQ